MGKMKNGILDAFSGTIGRVVGTSWRGVAVMRSKAHSRKNANTPKQQEQKAYNNENRAFFLFPVAYSILAFKQIFLNSRYGF